MSARGIQVSIRAPLRRAGRYRIDELLTELGKFQSAPRSEERGDKKRWFRAGARAGFNPRPAPKSGAMGAWQGYPQTVRVSIRAPLRRAGR